MGQEERRRRRRPTRGREGGREGGGRRRKDAAQPVLIFSRGANNATELRSRNCPSASALIECLFPLPRGGQSAAEVEEVEGNLYKNVKQPAARQKGGEGFAGERKRSEGKKRMESGERKVKRRLTMPRRRASTILAY